MTIQDPRAPTAAAQDLLPALSDRPPTEAWLIALLRLWDDGISGQTEAWEQITRSLGPRGGARALATLEPFLDLLLGRATRALLRRLPGCCRVTRDEAAVAQMVVAAARGDRDEALLIGVALVRADYAPGLVRAAEQLGLALGLTAAVNCPGRPAGVTLH